MQKTGIENSFKYMHADTVGLKGLREVILACGGSQGCLLLFTRDACLKRFIDVPFQW